MSHKHDHVGDFGKLLNLLILAVEAQAGLSIPKGEAWINDRQILAKMLVFNLATVQKISQGSVLDVRGQKIPYVDHGSIKILTRAALENYLVFAHIYGPKDLEVSKFRHDVWKYCGMLDRQKLTPITNESRGVHQAELKVIERMRSELQSHRLIQAMDRRTQKSILVDGQWKSARPWRSLAREAGMNEVYFSNIYNYLCGYSHASYAAALQVGQAASVDDQNQIGLSMLGIGNHLMAKLLELFEGLFDTAAAAINASEHRHLIGLWGFDAEDFKEIYEKSKV